MWEAEAPTTILTAFPTAQVPVVMGKPAYPWDIPAGRYGSVGQMDEKLTTIDQYIGTDYQSEATEADK